MLFDVVVVAISFFRKGGVKCKCVRIAIEYMTNQISAIALIAQVNYIQMRVGHQLKIALNAVVSCIGMTIGFVPTVIVQFIRVKMIVTEF